MVFDVVSAAIGGAVAAVTSPVVYTWVKNKVVAPFEAKIAALEAAVKAAEKKV